MKHIKKIVGRAGTGKTTYMVNELNTLFTQGVKPWEIGMVSYLKVGAQVFIDRSLELTSYQSKHFTKFGTMHRVSSKLVQFTGKNMFTNHMKKVFRNEYYSEYSAVLDEFDETHYRLTPSDKKKIQSSSKFDAMESLNNLLRVLCIEDDSDKYNQMQLMTGRDLEYTVYTAYEKEVSAKYDKIILGWRKQRATISPIEQDEFNVNYKKFKMENDLMDYTDTLERVLEEGAMLDVKHLFVDEFQDFNRLQLRIYQMWRDNPSIETIHIAGDDAQTINRFTGGNPQYFISEPADENVILPKTYRHGKLIFNDAKQYLDKMSNVIECDVLPSEIDGEIIQVYENEWLDHLDFAEDESVLVLSATNDWSQKTKTAIKEVLPDTHFGTLGNTNKEERVMEFYNVIASLERGEEVEWERVKQMFVGTSHFKSKMVTTEITTTLAGSTKEKVSTQALKRGILVHIKNGMFVANEVYTKETFEADFLEIKWNGRTLLNNIPDIEMFETAQDHFPGPATAIMNKRVGTIHKSKGDEADTVILFMSVHYPMQNAAFAAEGRDDILHLFYVGKTRAKKKLIEVYGYHTSGNGSIAPTPLELV